MKLKIPDTYTLIFVIILILGLASNFIPAGNYERHIDSITGIEYVVPGSYETVEKTIVSPFKVFEAIPQGIIEAADIIAFVFITGGSLGIIQSTGIVNALLGVMLRKYSGKEKMIIPIVMILFSLDGAITGAAEELLPFCPIFVVLAVRLGYDSITGLAMVLIGAIAGFATGFLNPFTTGIAQGFAKLPLFSGIIYRLICYVIIITVTIIYVCRYANKIKLKEVNCILENDMAAIDDFDVEKLPDISTKHKKVLATIGACFAFLIYGIWILKFDILDLSAVFLIMGIAAGFAGKMKASKIVAEFISGASNVLYGVLIIGLSRGILVVMKYGNIIDTVVYQLAKLVEIFPPELSAIGMFIVHSIIGLFITSSTGEASATMPIMINLADLTGVTRQTAVLAYQFGEAFTNVISPATGYIMAALAICGVSWNKWIKWILPLYLIWFVLSCILITVSVIICYGPF